MAKMKRVMRMRIWCVAVVMLMLDLTHVQIEGYDEEMDDGMVSRACKIRLTELPLTTGGRRVGHRAVFRRRR